MIQNTDSQLQVCWCTSGFVACTYWICTSFIVELLSDSRVFQAVLKHGGGQWFSIGLAMGFTGLEVEVCTSNKPSSGSKLQAVIEWKVRECGVKETEKCVLTACEGIPQPIIGSVLEYIERGSKGMSQHESVGMIGFYC